ncbi:MAG: putative 2-dehydropantoate 2-reductase [Nostocaceae cyanobacterium]|nr:putative 2-dehydropantoate 2-reductase [Nostocaceae cyanobacterium]
MSERTYAILGAGALGGFYGARLQKAGMDVHFLLNSDYEYVRENGLAIASPDGDFTLPQVHAYSNIKHMPQCDVVVIALKTTHNHILPQILPSVVKEDGVVLVLQNGLGVEEEVARIVGNERVIGGICFLTSNKVSAGCIYHQGYKHIVFGEYAANYHLGCLTDRMKQIGNDFELAGIPIELAPDLLLERWKKLVWNIPYNGLSVILDATTDELMADSHSLLLVEQLMHEVLLGAKSCDRIIPDSFIADMLEHTAKLTTPYRTSMKIDYESQRPLEVETIFGNPLRKATTACANLPQITCIYQQLKFLDTKNRRLSQREVIKQV